MAPAPRASRSESSRAPRQLFLRSQDTRLTTVECDPCGRSKTRRRIRRAPKDLREGPGHPTSSQDRGETPEAEEGREGLGGQEGATGGNPGWLGWLWSTRLLPMAGDRDLPQEEGAQMYQLHNSAWNGLHLTALRHLFGMPNRQCDIGPKRSASEIQNPKGDGEERVVRA